MEATAAALRALLARLTKMDKWSWFQEDPTDWEGYTDVVERPMCMDFMRQVRRRQQHQRQRQW